MERTVKVDVDPTPEELAEAFWQMDADQQARFFNYLGIITEADEKAVLPMQLQFLAESPCLLFKGRRTMEDIGIYAWEQGGYL